MDAQEWKALVETKNIDTIEKLEDAGFSGSDADLATSLFEYGLAWLVGEEETIFVYGISASAEETRFERFDRCTMENDLDVFDEYDWVDFGSVCSFVGWPPGTFRNASFVEKIYALVSYQGHEEIFGSSHWEGFKIKETLRKMKFIF